MNYKNFFSATALVTLLSLSHSAFSDPVGDIEDGDTSYYVRLQYNGEFFNKIGELKGKEDASGLTGNTERLAKGWNKEGNAAEDYKPTYKTSYLTGSVAAGYTMEGIRVELEGLYSQLNVDTKDYKGNGTDKPNNAKYLELTRDSGANDSKAAESSGTKSIVNEYKSPLDANKVAFQMKNEGFRNIAAMVNAYYDIDLGSDIPVVPYVGAGIGITQINFLGVNSYKPAYQAKAGVSYAVTPEIKLYAGARYFGVYGDEFQKINPVVALKKPSTGANAGFIEATTATMKTSSTCVYGIEAGVMFHF